ncbi:MAG: tetratricopeptide repeat protein [Pyrinomonadaceae bacterium]
MKRAILVGLILFVMSAPLRCRAQDSVAVPPQNNNVVAKNHDSAKTDAPTTAEGFYKLGVERFEAKKYKEAVDAFKKSLRLQPKDAKTNYEMGRAYSRLKLYNDAAEAQKRAIRLEPQWAEAHYQLGVTYYVIGKRDLAIEQFKILKNLNSDLSDTLNRILQAEKENAEAQRIANSTPRKTDGKQSSAPNATDNTGANDEAAKTTLNPSVTDAAEVKTDQPSSTSDAASKPGETVSPTDATNRATPAAETPKSESATAKNDSAKNETAEIKNDTAAPGIEPVKPVDEATLVGIYRVGVGDILDIRLLNSTSNRSTLYTVMEGGIVDYTLAGGPVSVNELTTQEIEARLAAELKRRGVSADPHVVVSVRDFVSHTVIMSGLVSNPGIRILHREAVPLYVLIAESQPQMNAGRVAIMRATGQGPIIDLNDQSAMSALVRPGDVITVLARVPQFYYIGGRVYTPGQKSFQSGITLLQAILGAGGLLRSGDNIVEVSRENADGRLTTTKFNLKEIKSGKIPDPRLQPGDRIEVAP